MRISLTTGPCGYPMIEAEDGREVLVQVDYDYPGVASAFGWSVAMVGEGCEHSGTDGTVDCRDCGTTAVGFIAAASEWMSENDGATVDDPGWFDD